MTKYDFIWRLVKLVFMVGLLALIGWKAMAGNGVAIGIALLLFSLVLMTVGAAVVSYSNQLHTRSLLSFMQTNAKENKMYIDAMKPPAGGGLPMHQGGGLLIDGGSNSDEQR